MMSPFIGPRPQDHRQAPARPAPEAAPQDRAERFQALYDRLSRSRQNPIGQGDGSRAQAIPEQSVALGDPDRDPAGPAGGSEQDFAEVFNAHGFFAAAPVPPPRDARGASEAAETAPAATAGPPSTHGTYHAPPLPPAASGGAGEWAIDALAPTGAGIEPTFARSARPVPSHPAEPDPGSGTVSSGKMLEAAFDPSAPPAEAPASDVQDDVEQAEAASQSPAEPEAEQTSALPFQLLVGSGESGVEVVLRAAHLERSARARLRGEVAALLARHGLDIAEFRLNGEPGPETGSGKGTD
ncbi:hypothetical protein [Allosphingosinicella deserti]|uniref:Uncharacterized protein n=1 Tax=Allosphingosinicella deserti TaxID=2116704 RepID=A0A2P7QW61_9SPHN|nr:hypothetical protein [Sphingomonas deserti]PSJ42202.1 hypothetical protein C7I55_08190 [Sphingomonas deserti]